MQKQMKTALLSAAGTFMIALAYSPANAADLGGGCCADLEERVAELEATTARKGNRVVTLQIYGQVSKSLLIWDDGIDNDVFVVDNDESGSRIGLKGQAAIKPGVTAGYNIELDIQDSASDKVSADDDEGVENEILIRKNEIYIESDLFGRVTLGQGSSASDGSSEVNLGGSFKTSLVNAGKSFIVRIDGAVDDLSGLSLGDFADNLDGFSRRDRIRYDSPSIYGFILSASWGEDDYWDAALRFSKEWNSVRLAAAISYLERSENEGDIEQVSGSVSMMHIPTGLYGTFAAGEQDDEDLGREATFYYGQIGITRRFLSYGATTLYGEYGQFEDFAQNKEIDIAGGINDVTVAGSDATLWGIGVNQKFDSAGLEIYAQYTLWEVEADLVGQADPDIEDLSFIMIGSRIKF